MNDRARQDLRHCGTRRICRSSTRQTLASAYLRLRGSSRNRPRARHRPDGNAVAFDWNLIALETPPGVAKDAGLFGLTPEATCARRGSGALPARHDSIATWPPRRRRRCRGVASDPELIGLPVMKALPIAGMTRRCPQRIARRYEPVADQIALLTPMTQAGPHPASSRSSAPISTRSTGRFWPVGAGPSHLDRR